MICSLTNSFIKYNHIVFFFIFCIFCMRGHMCHAYTKDHTEISPKRALFASLCVFPDRSLYMRRVACLHNCRICALTIVLFSVTSIWGPVATRDEHNNWSDRVRWWLYYFACQCFHSRRNFSTKNTNNNKWRRSRFELREQANELLLPLTTMILQIFAPFVSFSL